MRKIVLSILFIVSILVNGIAQDTLQIDCSEKITVLPSANFQYFKINGSCDSVYILNKSHYLSLTSKISDYYKFYNIYDGYRKMVKASDADMTEIINSYEQIIKTKDEAFGTLYNEYSKMNKLLDKSVGQTKKAVNLGETTLKEVKDINSKLQNENLKLNESLQHLKDIAQREKINAGLRGGIIGGSAALIIGGIVGGVLGYNLHR